MDGTGHLFQTSFWLLPLCVMLQYDSHKASLAFITVLDLSRTRNAHVFHSGNTVYKLYDNQFCKLQPNFDAIQSIDSDYLPDMKVVPLTDDKCVL